jgi:antitoxin Phd
MSRRKLTSVITSHMSSWQVQDAKARFSEFLEASLKQGPQMVTRRGVEAAVLVPIEQWRRLQQSSRPSLKQLLLATKPRFENSPSPRRRLKRRPPASF